MSAGVRVRVSGGGGSGHDGFGNDGGRVESGVAHSDCKNSDGRQWGESSHGGDGSAKRRDDDVENVNGDVAIESQSSLTGGARCGYDGNPVDLHGATLVL